MVLYKIVMVRHGESVGNAQGIICGWFDAKLTEKGIQEAQKAGQVLKNNGAKFDIAYTSLLSRAEDTLQHILTEIGQSDIPIIKTWRLNERYYGGLTGLSKAEIAAKYGQDEAILVRRGFNFVPPSMSTEHPFYETIVHDPRYIPEFSIDQFPPYETLRSAIERTLLFWHDTIVPQIKAGKRVIISSHEHTLRGIIQHLEKRTDDQMMLISLPNAVPFVYTLDENLRPVTEVEFLADPEVKINSN